MKFLWAAVPALLLAATASFAESGPTSPGAEGKANPPPLGSNVHIDEQHLTRQTAIAAGPAVLPVMHRWLQDPDYSRRIIAAAVCGHFHHVSSLHPLLDALAAECVLRPASTLLRHGGQTNSLSFYWPQRLSFIDQIVATP